jgi:tetratricopeptide (TPR) repeat protein
MATGTLSAEEIRGPARRLVRHLLRGCPDCAVAFGLAAGWRAGRLPLFHYEARVNRGIRRTIEGWQGRKVERERAEALIAEVRKLRRDDPEFGIALLEEALRRVEKAVASSSGSGPRGEGLACEIHTERANLLRLLGRHLEAEAAFQAGLEAWQADIGRAEALLNLGDLYGSFLIDRRRFTEADGLQSLATGL